MCKLIDSICVSLVGACKCSGHYLVTYEDDSTLFDSIFSPFCNLVSKPSEGASKPHIVDANFNEELVKKVPNFIF